MSSSPLRSLWVAGDRPKLARFNPALVAAIVPKPGDDAETLLFVPGSPMPLAVVGSAAHVEAALFDGAPPPAPSSVARARLVQ